MKLQFKEQQFQIQVLKIFEVKLYNPILKSHFPSFDLKWLKCISEPLCAIV